MEKASGTRPRKGSQAGISMIELMMAGAILLIGSLSMVGLIIGSIATNNRNKIDSSQTMLAESILEQINSTIIGVGTSNLTDCAATSWAIDTSPGGSALSGETIDFTESAPPDGYHMDYVVNTPCSDTGNLEGTYDVRWHVEIVGATNTYLLTVAARMKNHGEGNLYFAAPVTLRVVSGN